jgi:integrase
MGLEGFEPPTSWFVGFNGLVWKVQEQISKAKMAESKKRKYEVIDRYGDIAIEILGGSYQLRWSYGGRQYSRIAGKICPEGLKVARAKAQIINSDILMERFDTTLHKYFPPRQATAEHKATTEPLNLIKIWERYKIAKKKLVAATTQKGDWREVDRALATVKPEALEFSAAAATFFLGELLDRYASSTTRKILENIRAANFWAIDEELVTKNFYSRLFKNLPRSQKSGRSRKCFEKSEIEQILTAFTNDEFRSKFSVHSHSYYRGYAEFLALTGFRPEEAIALNWSNIKNSEIIVARAYSQGILKSTKTYETRSFPINSQLANLLKSLPNSSDLVFPSVEGGYIDQQRFNERYWKPIVRGLVIAGKVSEYLPTNNLRHSWITRMLRSGLDIATVARLAGNKPDTIMKHYLAAQTKDLILPEL